MIWSNYTWGVVFVFAWFAVAFWLFSDVYDQHGPDGCVILGLIYVLLTPIFPLVLIVYLVLRAISHGGPARLPKREEEPLVQQRWHTAGSGAWTGNPMISPGSGPISASESDGELDLLLAEGRFRQALEQAEEKLELAQSFGDPAGLAKYRKYVDFIRLRAAKR